MILYLIYGFGMVTCTVSPLSMFTAHLLPVYSATYKWTSGGILSTTLRATSCFSCIRLHRWSNGLRAHLECDRLWVGQTKDYKISICCFSAKKVVLRRKSTDWLAWNKDNVSQWERICAGFYCLFISLLQLEIQL
jgi:hypothetical protein